MMISAFYTQSGIISGCKLLIRYAQDVLQTGLRSLSEEQGGKRSHKSCAFEHSYQNCPFK